MDDARTCPQCGGRMALGFAIAKPTDSWPAQQRWYEGQAERSSWTGLKLKGRANHAIDAYRSERCTLVQHYAPAV